MQQLIAVGVLLGILQGLLIDTARVQMGKTIEYVHAQEPPSVVLIETKVDWTKDRIAKEIKDDAEKYHVKESEMQRVIDCESGGSTTIQSHWMKHGKRENSWGIVQINLDAHDVTKEQALDPQFAIDFLAKGLKEGNGKLWSCY